MAPDAQKPTFRTLFDTEFAYVCRSLERFGVQRADVGDAANDVFVAVHLHYAEYDPSRPLRPWLFAFAIRVAARYKEARRADLAMRYQDQDVDVPDRAPGAEERVAAEQRRRLVLRALESVEEHRRSVFVLHELDEVPVPDIAIALEIPLNTAYSRLRLARDEFRAAVKRLQVGERS